MTSALPTHGTTNLFRANAQCHGWALHRWTDSWRSCLDTGANVILGAVHFMRPNEELFMLLKHILKAFVFTFAHVAPNEPDLGLWRSSGKSGRWPLNVRIRRRLICGKMQAWSESLRRRYKLCLVLPQATAKDIQRCRTGAMVGWACSFLSNQEDLVNHIGGDLCSN